MIAHSNNNYNINNMYPIKIEIVMDSFMCFVMARLWIRITKADCVCALIINIMCRI